MTSMGERWELQLKGSGRTPYSRFGDGRAVLRSSVREFLCSEAMAALGVPTSRAAALVTVRDRVARFGSFEILATNSELAELRQLADFVLATSFPHIPEAGEHGLPPHRLRALRVRGGLQHLLHPQPLGRRVEV